VTSGITSTSNSVAAAGLFGGSGFNVDMPAAAARAPIIMAAIDKMRFVLRFIQIFPNKNVVAPYFEAF
jgi:hypothetical protein